MMDSSNPERLVYTPEEARMRLNLGKAAMYEALRRNDIPSIRIGRRILVPRSALEKLLGASGTADGRTEEALNDS